MSQYYLLMYAEKHKLFYALQFEKVEEVFLNLKTKWIQSCCLFPKILSSAVAVAAYLFRETVASDIVKQDKSTIAAFKDQKR